MSAVVVAIIIALVSSPSSSSALVVAAAAAAVDETTTTTTMTVEPIAYEDPYHDLGDNATATTTTALLGYMSVPQSVIEDPTKQVPAVIILPTWNNVNDYVKIRATMIADEYGWIGFTADLYGADRHDVQDPTYGIQMEQATLYRSNPMVFNARIQAAIDTVAHHPNVDPTNIALIGYCLGGTGVLSYSFANIDTTETGASSSDPTTKNSIVGGVSFHGGLLEFEVDETRRMMNPVLVLSGGSDDTGTAVEALERQLVQAQPPAWQITRYADIVHGFTVFDLAAYDAWVDHRAWDEMGTFLQEVFGEIQYGSSPPQPNRDYYYSDATDSIPIGSGSNDTENEDANKVAVETIMYDDHGFALMGYLAIPPAVVVLTGEEESRPTTTTTKKYPAVVIVPDWDGVNEYELERAVMTAQHRQVDKDGNTTGQYIAMAADIYGVNYTTVNDFQKRIELSTLYRSNPTLFVSRIQAAINELLNHPNVDPEHIFVAGYCFGGTGSVDYGFAPTNTTYTNVQAVVPIHGGLSPLRTIETEDGVVSPYILVLSGGVDDAHGNTTELEQHLDSTDAKWEITRYSNAEHGFTKWGSAAYQPMADSRSWSSMMSLFDDFVQIDNNSNNTKSTDDATMMTDDTTIEDDTNSSNDNDDSLSSSSSSLLLLGAAAAATVVVTAVVTGMLVTA